MTVLKITIDGNPIPQKRPRFVRKGAFVSTYDVQKKEKQDIKNIMIRQIEIITNSDKFKFNLNEIVNATSLSVQFVFHLPVSKSDPEHNSKVWGFIAAIKKIDIDNLCKLYLDCANGVFWNDDSIVTNLNACKIYSENPKTEMTIMPIKDYEVSQFSQNIITTFTPTELDEFLLAARDLGKMVDKNMYELDREETKAWIEETSTMIANFANDYSETIKKVKKKL